MKKVSIFSTFYSVDRAYSLTNVVEEQIKMFVNCGYKINVIVTENFKPDGYFSHEGVTLKFIPDVPRSNDGILPADYEKQVEKVEKVLAEVLEDTDVCITHDVIYQPAHIIFNLAARNVARERKDLRWLHWIHSATSPAIRCSDPIASGIIQQKFPNSFVCYPNSGDIPRVARNFKYEEDEVKRVHHSTDIPDYLNFHPLSKQIYREKRFTDADVIAVYPIRLDRGKQVEHVIKTLGAIKRIGRNVKGLLMDFHSASQDPKDDKFKYRISLKEEIKNQDLENDVFFTTELDESLKHGCPREMVKDFMLASNFYMHPSTSETYSLVVQEAIICKNFILLNKDFPPIRSVYGDTPLYKQFSSAIDALSGLDGSTITKHENENNWYEDLAKAICYYLENNPVLALNTKVRKERNPEYIFRMELEPLLYAGT